MKLEVLGSRGRYCVGNGGKMRPEKGKLGLPTKPLLCIYWYNFLRGYGNFQYSG